MNVLFVCRGNVGRSVIAEALFNKLSKVHHASSAGTKLSGPEQVLKELSPAVDNILTVMQEEGIDVSEHTRTQITTDMVDAANRIILVVDDNDPLPEYLLNNPKVVQWSIFDPKDQSLEFTRNTKKQIKNYIQNFIQELNQ